MPVGCYQVHGLVVHSEVGLHALSADQAPVVDPTSNPPGPGGRPSGTAPAGPDLRIAWGAATPVTDDPPAGATVAALAVAGRPYFTAVRRPDGTHLLRAHRLCDFVVDVDERTIVCQPDPQVDGALVPVLLGGTVTAFYLGLAGRPVLHGAAVASGASAVAFVGHSGAGKSTVAAMACAAGAGLVSDDVLHLDLAPDVRCLGRSAELRLKEAALSVLDGLDPAPAVRPTADGKLAVSFPPAPPGDLGLARIAIPRPSRTSSEVEVRYLAPVDAALELSRYPRILGWVAPEVMAAQFDTAVSLCRRVAVCEVVVPWGPPFPAERGAEVLDRLCSA